VNVTCAGVHILFASGPRRWLPAGAVRHVIAGQRWWGGWGSNPRPADYESSILANAYSRLYLRERETDHRCQPRPDRVFAMISSESHGEAAVVGL